LAVVIPSAATLDRDGGKLLFIKAATSFPTISLVWSDGGYAGKLIQSLNHWCGWVLEIVRKVEQQAGLQFLRKRWIVERTFA
jgi:putative transposase